jgi:multiple sugar transport system permease protein
MTMMQTLRGRRMFTHILLMAGALVMLYPLLWMLSSSFKPQSIIFTEPSLVPSQITFDNYSRGWTALQMPFSRFFLNSFIIVTFVVIGNTLTCSFTAFAFARLNFRFKRIWFTLMLGTIMLPGHVTLIPTYVLFNHLGWLNTFLPLTVPHFFSTSAFFVFLMVQFIRGIPRDLDDAAAVDGAGIFQIYWRIILPLCTPALITTAIFSFIWEWDNFFSHLLYINSISLFTVPLGLRAFIDATGESSYGPLFAMSILSLMPVFIFFITAQRQLVEGISTTGFKG